LNQRSRSSLWQVGAVGADGFTPKPLNIASLSAIIEQFAIRVPPEGGYNGANPTLLNA